MFKILIDADACPVKDEVYKVAIRNNLNVVVVSNGGIRPYKHPLIKNVYVGQGFNEADEYILDLLSEKDIVVTNDILLACLLYTSPSPRDATLSRMPSSA